MKIDEIFKIRRFLNKIIAFNSIKCYAASRPNNSITQGSNSQSQNKTKSINRSEDQEMKNYNPLKRKMIKDALRKLDSNIN